MIPIFSDQTEAERKQEHGPAWQVAESEFELLRGGPVAYRALG